MTTRPVRHPRSSELFARAQQILPGGVDSPVRAFTAVGGGPLFIDRARGSRIRDVDGRTYIDYVMSWGPLIHGHAPRGLVRALASAARKGTSFGAPAKLEVQLAERVRRLMPSMEKMRFVNSGTEAAMSVIRVARAATRRDKIVKFEGCYHGHADPFLVKAGSGLMTLGVPTSPGVPPSAASDTLVATYNDLRSCDRLCESHPGKIAAVIVEPIAGNMGVVAPTDGFLQGLRDLCSQHRMLLVFDEVISGFRASMGGGLPVGAYGGRTDLMDLVAPTGPVYQAGTLSGNPLAMTAGIWSLGRLSKRLYRKLGQLGAMLAAGLAEAARAADVPIQVNGFGSVLTPFFTSEPVRDYESAMKSDTKRYAAFFHAMLARGIYLPPSQFEAWFLSDAHSERDVIVTVRAAREAMKEVGG